MSVRLMAKQDDQNLCQNICFQVKDAHLQKHLAHFGINMTQLQKTEKSMVELEIEMNLVREHFSFKIIFIISHPIY